MIQNELIAVGEVLAPVVGYGIGQLMEQSALRTIANNRERIFDSHDINTSNVFSRNNTLRRAFTQLALMGAVSGGLLYEGLKPAGHTSYSPPEPAIALAVDHSYGVTTHKFEDTINGLTLKMAATPHLNVETYVGHNSDAELQKDSKAIGLDTPIGRPSVDTATRLAVSAAYNNAKGANNGQAANRNAGVLVVTGGNSAGHTQSVIRQSKEQGNVPIYIADTGNSGTATAKDLQLIAQKTHGQYWQLHNNADKIAQTIATDLKPQSIEKTNHPDRLPFLFFAATLAGLTMARFKQRSTETAVS